MIGERRIPYTDTPPLAATFRYTLLRARSLSPVGFLED